MDPEQRRKVCDPEERMKGWSDWAFMIPLIAVPLAWLVGYRLYRWVIVCGGDRFGRCSDRSGLSDLKDPLSALPLEADPAVRVAHDVAARFAWQPTLVAFVVVALGAVAACWYLIHRSMQDSVPWYTGRAVRLFNVIIGVVAIALAVASWVGFPVWVVHTEVLGPTLRAALGPDAPAVRTAEQIQHVFQVLAVVASGFVVGAASTALLTPIWTPQERQKLDEQKIASYTTHLADQWRRLSLTLYAGAALLVTAVVHQSAMYAWGNAFAEAMAETRSLRAQRGKATVDSLEAEMKIAQARVVRDTATRRVDSPAAARLRPDRALQRSVAVLAFEVDSAKQTLVRDSVGAGARESATRATITRIGQLMSRAITRGGGLVYTILLAVTYLPAALVLMERAWELSFVAMPDGAVGADGQPLKGGAKRREEWRVHEGVGFSVGDQWTRIFAVLSPVLASGGAVALAELYKLISG